MSNVVQTPSGSGDDGQFAGPNAVIARLRQIGAEELLKSVSDPALDDSGESCLMIDALVGYVKQVDYLPPSNQRDPSHALTFKFRVIEALQGIGLREETVVGGRAIYALGEIGGRDAQIGLQVIFKSATSPSTKLQLATSLGELRESDLGIANRILVGLTVDKDPVVAEAAKHSMVVLSGVVKSLSLDTAISNAQTHDSEPRRAIMDPFSLGTTIEELDPNVGLALSRLATYVTDNFSGLLDDHFQLSLREILDELQKRPPTPDKSDMLDEIRRVALVEEHFEANDVRKTLALALDGLSVSPGNVKLWYLLGKVVEGFGDMEALMGIYDHILRIDPKCAEVQADLEILKELLGHDEDGD